MCYGNHARLSKEEQMNILKQRKKLLEERMKELEQALNELKTEPVTQGA